MYEYIKGQVEESSLQHVILDVNGIGYKLLIPMNAFSKLPKIGAILKLYTYFHVRENEQTLFGFLSKDDRELFLRLIDVSGIGPKTGLSMIGHGDLVDIPSAILQGNIASLCRLPGIGKKTAERLILEVKDKLPPKSFAPEVETFGISHDATLALINLGYLKAHAEKAIKIAQKDQEIDDLGRLITEALKHI